MQRPANKHLKSDAGFTLVELIIASGIVGLSMAMAMGSIISVSTAQQTTESDAIATALVTSVLEEIRSTTAIDDVYSYVAPDISNLGLGASAVVTVACVDAANNVIALPLTADQGSVEVYRPTLPNPAEIQVTIQWMDHQGRRHAVQASSHHRRL
jgi:prepilin-type N-terminal cleavage/methylation domain-containing protein